MSSAVCVEGVVRVLFIGIVYVCVRTRAHAVLCASVFAMFCMKMLIFVCFVRLYTTDLYNYGYLCIFFLFFFFSSFL